MLTPTATFATEGSSVEDLVAVLHRTGVAVGSPRRVCRSVLDTFDGLLHGAGLRLTLHEDGPRRTVALTGAGVVGVQTAVPDRPVWPDDLPAGPLRARVAAVVDVRALRPVLSITATARDAVRFDGRRKEVVRATVLEAVTIGPDRLTVPGTPLVEVLALAGYPKPAADLEGALARHGAHRLADDLVDVAAALAGVDLAGYSSSPTVTLDANMSALDGWCAVLANLTATARINWDGTLAQIDTEFLHELRVAVRRSRSILNHGSGVVPADVLAWSSETFAEIGAATGPARDFDVQLLSWPDHVRRLGAAAAADLEPVHELLVERHVAAHALLDAELAAPATLATLDAWAAWLADPAHPGDRESAPLAEQPLGAVVAKRIRKAHRRIIDDGRQIGATSPAESLHDLRKQAKKLRYLLECFASLLPAAERKQFVRALKVLQDNLGEHQDAAVHADELRAVGEEVHAAGVPAGTMFALGELRAQVDAQRAVARAEFAERFAEFDTAETRQALRAMLAGLPTLEDSAS